MSEEKVKEVDRKVYPYLIISDKSSDKLFEMIKNKINNNYENLEKRKLIYTDSKTRLKFFLDVKNKKEYRTEDIDKRLVTYECILYKLRETDFPYLFDLLTGKKSNIGAADTEALMEQTHFIVYPQINLIISENNHSGAPISKLSLIVEKVLEGEYNQEFELRHILNTKTAVKVNNMKKIDKFTFKAGHQGLKTISSHFNVDMVDVIDKCFDNYSDLEFEITIKGKGRGKKRKNLEIKKFEEFKKLCGVILDSKNKKKLDIKKAEIREVNQFTELPIDLFSEYLVCTTKVIKISEKSKYIDSEDMFEKLMNIYKDNIFEISNFIKVDSSI
ncbi:MAG: hypothetical protein SO128_07560 [Clostridium cadaveris]|mgnify:CR=1 FL=1|uniref:hypothetical protein n=1 Tax=Clostridium cadaveris TaxID=1529 RepID=UPI0014598F26|nr:hypothetical protein [Clostridium cadaveris]MDY4949213.1 hypothetical protein [Clostridium cadaveris]NME66312.1 hypothetical protein [Clostridium cadaveris]